MRTQTIDSVAKARGLLEMRHDVDPKQSIIDLVTQWPGLTVTGPQVLVATYIRPKITKGGIHITDTARGEDEYQGKVGLVIAVGPTAFKPGQNVDFGGVEAKMHDWIVYSPHDGLAMNIGGLHCRMIDDVQVRMILAKPDMLL